MSRQKSAFVKSDYGNQPLIPLRKNSKVALLKGWKTSAHTGKQLAVFQAKGHPLAIRTDNLTVVDVDEKELARQVFKKHKDELSIVVVTKSGAHFYFQGVTRNAVRVDGQPIDLRSGNGGYAVAPGSVINGHRYVYAKGFDRWEDLKPVPLVLLPSTKLFQHRDQTTIHDAEAYISKIFAISGSGGHNSCFRAVCILHKAGFDEYQAYAALKRWNESNTGSEPFSHKELIHKIKSVFRRP